MFILPLQCYYQGLPIWVALVVFVVSSLLVGLMGELDPSQEKE